MSKEPRIAKEICKLLATHHLLTAVEIKNHLGRNVNKTTVYRAIDRLMDSGLIRREVFGKETKFELKDDHHDHVVCNNCCKVEAVECNSPKKVVPGFSIDHHHTVMYGVCSDCQ